MDAATVAAITGPMATVLVAALARTKLRAIEHKVDGRLDEALSEISRLSAKLGESTVTADALGLPEHSAVVTELDDSSSTR